MNRRTRRSRAAMMVTVPVVLAVGGFWAVDAARGAGDSVVVTAAAAGSTASPAATPEEIGPDGWPKSMRACLKASGFEMKSVEGGTIVVTRDEDTQKFSGHPGSVHQEGRSQGVGAEGKDDPRSRREAASGADYWT
jgi:hypothetical protein